MNEVEDKAVLMTTLDTLRREVRIITENIADKNRELATIISFKKQNEQALEDSRDQLTKIVNRISEEKLSWSQEKHEEWAKIEARNAEIDRIVAIESQLQQRHAELNRREEEIDEKAKKDNEALLATKSLETVLDAKRAEIEAEKQIILNHRKSYKNEITNAKLAITNVLKALEKL